METLEKFKNKLNNDINKQLENIKNVCDSKYQVNPTSKNLTYCIEEMEKNEIILKFLNSEDFNYIINKIIEERGKENGIYKNK